MAWCDKSVGGHPWRVAFVAMGLACLGALTGTTAFGQVAIEAQSTEKTIPSYAEMVARGSSFLLDMAQGENGAFSTVSDPAITALCVTALLRHGRSPDDPALKKSLEYLATFTHPDGGIYAEGSNHQNYETCIAIMAFGAANQDGRYHGLLAKAEAYVRNLQWDQGDGKGPDDVEYGGGGYGRSKRPDLSNTQFLIEALRRQETEENKEAISRALVFVSRCQNLESTHNTTPFASKNPDGGFYYTPAAGGSSMAGTTEAGGLRSYGSMTYAGLKSMIFAGLSAEDPRVKAALGWIAKNYSLTENPGMGTSGLFYYYHTFAKALDALGESELTDSKGTSHNWRAELIAKLAASQRPDGSWINSDERWLEGNTSLVTAYALLALDHCRIEAPQ